MLIDLPQQLSKLDNPSLFLDFVPPITPCHSVGNLGFIIGSSLCVTKQISSLSKYLSLPHP